MQRFYSILLFHILRQFYHWIQSQCSFALFLCIAGNKINKNIFKISKSNGYYECIRLSILMLNVFLNIVWLEFH